MAGFTIIAKEKNKIKGVVMLEKIIFKSAYTYERTIVSYLLICLILLLLGNYNSFGQLSIYFIIALLTTALFCFKKFLFFENRYVIIYPLRPFLRKKSISYNEVKKIIYYANQIKIIKRNGIFHTYIKTQTLNKSEVIKFFKEIKKRGIQVDINTIYPEDKNLFD